MKDNSELRKLIRESIMEEMGKEKRYVATMDFYVYANDDQDAVNKSQALANNMNMNLDNQAAITGLVKQEHGTIGNTPVDFNECSMLMLKRDFSGENTSDSDE